jgi:hypothetical protein
MPKRMRPLTPASALAFALAAALPTLAYVQQPSAAAPASVDRLARQWLARSLAARQHGAAMRLARIRTMSIAGTLRTPRGPVPFVVRSAAPRLFRLDLHFPQGVLTQAFDGRRAWQRPPGAAAQWLSGAAARQVEDEALGVVDLTVAPARQGTRVSFAGSGSLDGRRYAALRFVLATGDAFTQYFDAQTGLTFAERYPTPHGTGIERIREWRPVEGLLFPFEFVESSGPHGVVLQRRRVELNRPIPAAAFRFPARAAHLGHR